MRFEILQVATMNDNAMLDRAIEIAQIAHQGQLDKVGEPFIEHCRRVAHAVLSTDEKTVAYLHDVVEKTRSWPLERLAAEGFPTRILEAVQALTRAPAESDENFVRRAVSNDLARSVKIADLNDNLVQALQIHGDVDQLVRELIIARTAA